MQGRLNQLNQILTATPGEDKPDGSIEPADISLSGERRPAIIAAGRAGWRYRKRAQVEKPGSA